MHTTFTIDWLAFSAVGTYDANHPAIAYKYETWSWMEGKGSYGYDKSISTSDGCRIMWSSTRQDMGTYISYSGKALNAYLSREIYPTDIMQAHVSNGDVCKRIDLAIDVSNSAIEIADLYDLLKRGLADTTAKKYSLITSNTGDTLYVGSRESEQFLRIYDKAKEQGDMATDKKRIELEIKGDRSKQICAILSDATIESADRRTRALINSVIVFDSEIWREIMGTDAQGLARSKDNDSDTEKWLLEQVAPAMARYILKVGKHDVLKRFINIVSALSTPAVIEQGIDK